MNLRSKKTIFILIVVIIIVIGVVLTVKKSTEPKLNDTGGPSVSGLVDPGNGLLNVTTSDDFTSVKNRITDFLVTQGAQAGAKVVISDVQPATGDSEVLKFNITVESLNQKNIPVEVDFAADPEPVFTVPSKSFKVLLVGEEP